MIEIFAPTPEHIGLDTIGDYARRVEAMGFDGLFVPDAIHDGLLLACQALAATRRLRVTTSVLVAFPRSPMNVALAAWDLQRLSGGRFELGLGTQIKQNIEERYSARWLPPVAGMSEYIGALRAIFESFRTRMPPNFVGQHYQFTRLQPFFNPGPLDVPEPPILLGAVGPKMLELTGAIADGLLTHPTNTSTSYLRQAIHPQLAMGATRRSPGRPPLKVSTNAFVASGPDDAHVATERERFRALLAFLFSTPAYWPSLELFGWRELGAQLQAMARRSQWRAMTDELNDTVLDKFLVSGRYDQLPAILQTRFGGLTERISLTVTENCAYDTDLAEAVAQIRCHWDSPPNHGA